MNQDLRQILHIVRLCTSTYQSPSYLKLEASAFNDLKQAHYHGREIPAQGDLALITNTQLNFNQISQDILKRTKLMIHPNSGFDNIPESFVKNNNFPIILGNPIRANAVVEYTLGCLFHHYSHPPFSENWQNDRQWPRQLLAQQKVQLIGFGYIGRKLAEVLNILCDELWIYDPREDKNEFNPEKANIIILAASLEKDSYKLINKEVIEKLKKDVLIINGARGQLLDQEHIIQFLTDHPQAKAFLDVFAKEPFQSEFRDLKNVSLSSHIAGVHSRLDLAIAQYVKEVIKDFLSLKTNEFKQKYSKINLQNFHSQAFLS